MHNRIAMHPSHLTRADDPSDWSHDVNRRIAENNAKQKVFKQQRLLQGNISIPDKDSQL